LGSLQDRERATFYAHVDFVFGGTGLFFSLL